MANDSSINTLAVQELLGSLGTGLSVTPTDPTDSDVSTADTIRLMYAHSSQAAMSEQIQAIAEGIRERVGDGGDVRELVSKTYDWIQENVTFVPDEDLVSKMFGIDGGVELLISPDRLVTMNRPMGDCDDFSSLARAILLNFGIDSKFVTVAADSSNVGKWSHVYNYVPVDGEYIPFDSSHGKFLGWETNNITRKEVWGGLGMILNAREQVTPRYPNYGRSLEHANEHGLRKRRLQLEAEVAADGGDELEGLGAIDWGGLFKGISDTTSKILIARYATPKLDPNVYIRNPDGSLITNQPGQPLPINLSTSGFGGSSLFILGGLGLLAIVLSRGR